MEKGLTGVLLIVLCLGLLGLVLFAPIPTNVGQIACKPCALTGNCDSCLKSGSWQWGESLFEKLMARQITSSVPQDTRQTLPVEKKYISDDNWVEYVSPRGKYKMAYPPEFQFVESIDGSIRLDFNGPDQKMRTEYTDGILLVLIYGQDIGSGLLSQVESEYNRAVDDGVDSSPITDVMVNGVAGKAFETNGLGHSRYVFLPTGEKTYLKIIISGADPKKRGWLNVVVKILNTITLDDENISKTSSESGVTVKLY